MFTLPRLHHHCWQNHVWKKVRFCTIIYFIFVIGTWVHSCSIHRPVILTTVYFTFNSCFLTCVCFLCLRSWVLVPHFLRWINFCLLLIWTWLYLRIVYGFHFFLFPLSCVPFLIFFNVLVSSWEWEFSRTGKIDWCFLSTGHRECLGD